MTEAKQLTKDRNYYRMMSDAELIALCKSRTVTELEKVLAERLVAARKLHHI
jgi:hypothetical protein